MSLNVNSMKIRPETKENSINNIIVNNQCFSIDGNWNAFTT